MPNDFIVFLKWKVDNFKKETNKVLNAMKTWANMCLIAFFYIVLIRKDMVWGLVILGLYFLLSMYHDFLVHKSQWKHFERKQKGRIYPSEVRKRNKKQR